MACMTKTKRLLVFIAALAVLLSLAVWIFFPRSIKGLIIDEKSTLSSVEIVLTDTFGSGETEKYLLEGENLKAFLELAEKSRVFLNPLKKSFVNSTGLQKEIMIFPQYSDRNQADGVPPYVSFFTKRIITVENTQYCLYGNSFLEGVLKLVSQ